MFAYPCGTTYSVTLVTAHAQCILVNQKVKGCLYMSHEKFSEPWGDGTLLLDAVRMRIIKKTAPA